jgi:transcriptional regulator with XRE-family HTH domain
MPARPKIGAQIRRARQLLNMRQQDLADKLGVSRSAVDGWENNRSYPQRNLARLEQLLGVRFDGTPMPRVIPQNEWQRLILEDETLPLDERIQIIQIAQRHHPAVAPEPARRPAGDGHEGTAPASQAG